MRLLIALAAIAVPFAATPAHTPAAKDTASAVDVKPVGDRTKCQRADVHPADRGVKGEFKRLDELPPAQLVLTVVREVDGCNVPVIVRQGYGLGSRLEEQVPVQPRARARRW